MSISTTSPNTYYTLVMCMELNVLELPDIPLGKPFRIVELPRGMKRLMELGFCPGVTGCAVHVSLSGQLRAYELLGTVIALRDESARMIKAVITA